MVKNRGKILFFQKFENFIRIAKFKRSLEDRQNVRKKGLNRGRAVFS